MKYLFFIFSLAVSLIWATAVSAKTQVAVTLYPIYLLAQGVADKEHFELICLQKSGDTHELAISAKDIAALKNVKLLITSELGLDNAVVTTVKKAWPKIHTLNVSKKIALIKSKLDNEKEEEHFANHHHEGIEHQHHHGEIDPHIWLGLDNAKTILDTIASNLIKLEPNSKNAVNNNLKSALEKINQLERLVQSNLAQKSIKLIAFHSAWSYFERSTGVKVVASISVNPETEPSAQRIKEIVQLARKNKIDGFIVETGMPIKAIKTIQREVKLPIVVLNPLDNVDKYGFEHYVNEMKKNILNLSALK